MQTYGQRWRRQDGRQEQARGHNAILRSQGRELGRRFTDSAGSRRQERAAGSRGQQEQQAGRESRTAGRHGGRAGQTSRRQEQRAARLPSFLCTNTFVAAFVLVPIMYRYRNKDELGNSCALRPTTQ